jgi:hypothetical protein
VSAEPSAPSPRRPRRRSWITLGLLGAFLTAVGLFAAGARPPSIELFPKVEGISEADVRLLDAVKTIGGEAHFIKRTPRFLGLFGGHDYLVFSFQGKSFDDAALARFVATYGDRVWGLYMANTGVTDEGLRHLAGLPSIEQLGIGNVDPRDDRHPPSAVTDAGLVHLKGLTTLKALDLGGLPITDAGLEAVKDLPNLGALYLQHTRVRGSGLGRLKSLPGLAIVYLDGSAVTDEGLAALGGATNLQVLSLSGVPLTGRGLLQLQGLFRLKRLDIQGCGIDAEDLDDIQAALPAVKFE